MAIEIKWTLQSIDDLVSIADFISKDSPYFAQVQTEKFFSRVEILEKHPYRILSKDRIDIITVHHSNKLLKDFL